MKLSYNSLFITLLFSSLCSAQWTQSTGTESLNIQALLTVGSTDFAGGATGTYRSTNEANSYTLSNTGNDAAGPTRGFTTDGTYIYTCTSQGVFRSADNGATWVSKSAGVTNLLSSGIVYATPYLILVGPSGVFKSSDSGESWTTAGLGGTDVRCVAAINSSIFVGTNGSGLYTSADWGVNWTAINNGLTGTNFRAIEAKGTTLFAGGQTGSGAFKSIDNGVNWSLIGGGLPTSSFRGFASNDAMIVAGAWGGGVFYSLDNGDSWDEINSGLLDLTIFDLALNDNFIVAATNTAGVFRFSLANITLAVEDFSFKNEISVYPNPTTNAIWVESEKTLQNTKFTIVDTKGATILSGTMTSFKTEINVEKVANGIYYLHVEGIQNAAFKFIKE